MKDFDLSSLKLIHDGSNRSNDNRNFTFSDLSILSTGYQSKFSYKKGPYKPNYHVLQYVTDGKGMLEIENKSFSVQTGDLFYLPQDVSCCYYGDELDPYEYYWVDFSGTQATYLLNACGISPSSPILHLGNHSEVEKIFQDMFAALFVNDFPSCLYAFSDLIKLFSILANPTGNLPSRQKHFIVDKAISLMDTDPASIKSIQQMCNQMGINFSHFSKIFKEQTKISPKLYLNRQKISHAKKMLSETDLPIKAIALELGFSENAFIRAFQRLTNNKPLEYRKKMQRPLPQENQEI